MYELVLFHYFHYGFKTLTVCETSSITKFFNKSRKIMFSILNSSTKVNKKYFL